jgi:hypothetical protein
VGAVLTGVFLGVLLGVLVAGGLRLLSRCFPAIGACVWRGSVWIVAAAGLTLAATEIHGNRDAALPTECTILESSIPEHGAVPGALSIRARWRAEGKTFTMSRPARFHPNVPAGTSPGVLVTRYAPGTTMPCMFRASRPARVLFVSAAEVNTARRQSVFFHIAAPLVLVLAARRFGVGRSGQPVRAGWSTSMRSARGGAGLALLACAVTGALLHERGHDAVGLALAIAGLGGWIAMALADEIRSARGFQRLRASLSRLAEWRDAADDFDGIGADPRGVTGLFGGCRVWARSMAGGAFVRVSLARWPAEMGAFRRTEVDVDAAITGDPEFDRAIALFGWEVSWRPCLTQAVRRALLELVKRRGARIEAPTAVIECMVDESDTDKLDALVEEMVALARALPDLEEVHAAVFQAARREPLASVRRGHYDWLLAERWDVPQILRTAARDVDPGIAAWARSQLPPDQGVYR